MTGRETTFAGEGSQNGLPFHRGRHCTEQLQAYCCGYQIGVHHAPRLKANLLMDAIPTQAACMGLPASRVWLQALREQPLSGPAHIAHTSFEPVPYSLEWYEDSILLHHTHPAYDMPIYVSINIS